MLLLLSVGQTAGVSAQPPPMPPPPGNRPPSPSVGTRIPETYFGPMPVETQKELIGPYQLLKAGKIDQTEGTITLPLYRGRLTDGRSVWYILTDTDDEANAKSLGLNFSAKLTYADVGKAVRSATLEKDGVLVFNRGTVDFAPEMQLVPGDMPNPFPPKMAQAGSIGDADYSPLVRITNAGGHIYNAPIVAFNVNPSQITFCNGMNVDHRLVHDHITKICPTVEGGGTVTLKLVTGFSFAKPVLYLSTDASDPIVARLEESTYAPAMKDFVLGRDDGAFSAVERIFITINGPMGAENPQRQGINSGIVDGGGPMNIFGGIPTVALDYSPIWDGNVGVWTQDAISKGYRSQIREEFHYLDMAERGFITGPNGMPFGSAGFVINCTVAMRLL